MNYNCNRKKRQNSLRSIIIIKVLSRYTVLLFNSNFTNSQRWLFDKVRSTVMKFIYLKIQILSTFISYVSPVVCTFTIHSLGKARQMPICRAICFEKASAEPSALKKNLEQRGTTWKTLKKRSTNSKFRTVSADRTISLSKRTTLSTNYCSYTTSFVTFASDTILCAHYNEILTRFWYF